MARILGQKSPFGGLCNCVRQKWGHATVSMYCSQSKGKISQNFVAFSEYMNFICKKIPREIVVRIRFQKSLEDIIEKAYDKNSKNSTNL